MSFIAKYFCFVWFIQNNRYFYTIDEIFTQLSTEFYLCNFEENDGQIFIWIQNYHQKRNFQKPFELFFRKTK